MARMLNIPRPEKRKNGVLAVQIRVPAELQKIVGKTVLRRSTGTKDDRVYNRLAPAIVLEFDAELQRARERFERLGRPAYRPVQIIAPFQGLYRDHPYLSVVEHEDGSMWVMSAAAPEPEEPKEWPGSSRLAVKVEPYMDSVKDWGARLRKGETTISRRMSKMRKLFEWLATQRGQPGFDDMNAVTSAELLRYEEEVLSQHVAEGKWKATTSRDHCIEIKAQFAHAKRRLKIDADPAIVLRTYDPDDGENDESAEWEDFTAAERDDILTAAAASDHPVVKFCNWLAAVHGSRVAELVEARTDHIYLDEETGMYVFNYTLKGRAKGRRLKTGFSARRLPIPQVIADGLGLLNYIESVRRDYHAGGHGDLFPMLMPRKKDNRLNTSGSKVLMDFLRNEVGIEAERKVFHSWRSTVATALEGKVSETRARYITGHAPRTKGERYIRHHLPELQRAIRRIKLPRV